MRRYELVTVVTDGHRIEGRRGLVLVFLGKIIAFFGNKRAILQLLTGGHSGHRWSQMVTGGHSWSQNRRGLGAPVGPTPSPSLAVTQSVRGRHLNTPSQAIPPLRAFSKGHTRRGTVTTKGGQGGEQIVIETRQRQRRRKDVAREDDEEEERTGARDNPRRRSIRVGERHSSADK